MVDAPRSHGDGEPGRTEDRLPSALIALWAELRPFRVVAAGGAVLFLALHFLAGLDAGIAVASYGAVLGLALIAGYPRRAAPAPAQVSNHAPVRQDPDMVATVTALPEAAFLLNTDGTVLVQNAAARELSAPVERGQHISAVLRAPEVLEALDAVVTYGEMRTVTYVEQVPVIRRLEAAVAPISPTGSAAVTPSHVLLLLQDLTQQQRLEKMRADFVANASHELRTPLASLLGFIETLQGSARDDAAARERFLEIMREQATRMARLISDLMSLSRIEANAHVRPEGPVDVRAVIGHVVDALAIVAEVNATEIRVSADPDVSYVTAGDADELTQVFQNLIENAIKYGSSAEGIDIRLTVSEREGDRPNKIDVAIQDYGNGIPAEHVPRLTERFYQVDVASSREKGGTGLGLAIVKHILNRHRATLTIDSREAEGSVFTVRFDAIAPDETV